jgi:hypothetical protein
MIQTHRPFSLPRIHCVVYHNEQFVLSPQCSYHHNRPTSLSPAPNPSQHLQISTIKLRPSFPPPLLLSTTGSARLCRSKHLSFPFTSGPTRCLASTPTITFATDTHHRTSGRCRAIPSYRFHGVISRNSCVDARYTVHFSLSS